MAEEVPTSGAGSSCLDATTATATQPVSIRERGGKDGHAADEQAGLGHQRGPRAQPLRKLR